MATSTCHELGRILKKIASAIFDFDGYSRGLAVGPQLDQTLDFIIAWKNCGIRDLAALLTQIQMLKVTCVTAMNTNPFFFWLHCEHKSKVCHCLLGSEGYTCETQIQGFSGYTCASVLVSQAILSMKLNSP